MRGRGTTNFLDDLDPALLRSGRCLQALEYPAFKPPEALAWLERQGCSAEVRAAVEPGQELVLADLYALLQGEGPRAARPQFGFRSASLVG